MHTVSDKSNSAKKIGVSIPFISFKVIYKLSSSFVKILLLQKNLQLLHRHGCFRTTKFSPSTITIHLTFRANKKKTDFMFCIKNSYIKTTLKKKTKKRTTYTSKLLELFLLLCKTKNKKKYFNSPFLSMFHPSFYYRWFMQENNISLPKYSFSDWIGLEAREA